MVVNRRQDVRKRFGYYMPVVDSNSNETVGYLSDISPRGFKIDSPTALAVYQDFSFRIDLSPELSDKPYMLFDARSKWCKKDFLDAVSYVVGFQVTKISAHDEEIFNQILEKYSVPERTW